ncbi:hypothetical protein [Oceanobacillus sp. CAU 1775]
MFEIYGVALIPLIIGLVQLIKTTGLNKKYLPFISLVFGLVGGIFFLYPGDIRAGIIVGLMLGLSASGLYSGTKNTLEKNDKCDSS